MLVSCFLGTTIEWYDFLVYAFLAPLAFNTLFFPALSPLAGTIAVFGVFAVGFAARPLGGVFFAHFGDRIGRKPIMISTLILMGASTTAMGLIPTYARVGIAAPIILVCLRFLGVLLAANPPRDRSRDGERREARAGCLPRWSRSGAAAGTVLGALAAFGGCCRRLNSRGAGASPVASADLRSQFPTCSVENLGFQRAVERAGTGRVPLLAVLTRCRKPAFRYPVRHGRVVDALFHVGLASTGPDAQT